MDNNDNINPFDQDDDPKRRLILLSLSVVAVLVCGVAFIVAFFYFQPDQLSQIARYFPSPTATSTRTVTPTPTNTSTPTPNWTATTRAQQATGTAAAYQVTAESALSEWQALFFDNFDTNANDWYVGTDDDEYTKIVREVKDGSYRWDATAHKGFVGWIDIPSKYVADFQLSVEMKHAEGFDDAEYGVLVRKNSKGYYYFRINDNQQFAFDLQYKDEWTPLISFTSTSAIQPGEANLITIMAIGDHFVFYINDQFVGETHNDQLKNGMSAIAIGLYAPDQKGTFEFNTIELRAPK